MAQNERQARINEVVKMLMELQSRANIVQSLAKKYNLKARAIDGYIKAAKPIVQERNEKLSKKIEAKHTEVVLAAETEGILNEIEVRRILSNHAKRTKKTTILSDWDPHTEKFIPKKAITVDVIDESVKAIEALNRMTGSNAPEKIAIKGEFVVTGMIIEK